MTALNSRSYAGVVCIVLLIGTNIFMGMALYRSYYSFSLDDGSTMDLNSIRGKNNDLECKNTTTTIYINNTCEPCHNTSSCNCTATSTQETCPECPKLTCPEQPVCNCAGCCPPPPPPPPCNECHDDTGGTPSFVIDLFIVHFMPKDTSRERILRPEPNSHVRLHTFVIGEANDTICIIHPVTQKLKCAPRLHASQQTYDLAADWQKKTLQVSYDYMLAFRLYEPTTTFTAIMEDDCTFCEQALLNGRVSTIMQFMLDYNVRDMVAGPGACGHIFWSSDVKQHLPGYFEENIVNIPRDRHVLQTVSGDELMKAWGQAHGGGYMTKYSMIRHFDGKSMTWSDSYTLERDRQLPHCGEIQSFVPPRYDTDNCWDVMFSPCHGYNKSKYAEDIGHNPYRIHVKSGNYMLGTTAVSRTIYDGGKATPYNEVDLRWNSASSMVVATMPNKMAVVLSRSGQDCASACSSLSMTCNADIDAAMLNDCSFVNAVFGVKPNIGCQIPFSYYGPFLFNRIWYLSPFASSRQARNSCTLPKFEIFYPNSQNRFVCTCT